MITKNGMQLGVVYVVTQSSTNGEFLVGERVRLMDNGDIMNISIGGWITSENVDAATEGMFLKVDEEWLSTKRKYIQEQLELLDSIV
jgi:hypothetical protein